MKTERARRIVVACAVLMLIVHAHLAHAFELRSSKTITWTVIESPETHVGTWRWELSALARDNHINDPKHGELIGIWSVRDGLPPRDPAPSVSAGGAPEPSASATTNFTATKPADLRNGLFEVTGVIDSVVKAVVVPPPGHVNQLALAAAAIDMALPSAFIRGFVLSSNDQFVVVDTPLESGKISLAAGLFGNGAAEVAGPVGITLLEGETGRTISEELYTFAASTNQFGSVVFGASTGIILEAPHDGLSTAVVSGGPVSSWIMSGSDPFAASLSNGVFTATGALESLPWLLTFDGSDVVRAMLLSEFFPEQSFAYRVPSSLITDDNTYQQTLLFDLRASVSESVSEPSTLALVGLAILLGSLLKRRCNRFNVKPTWRFFAAHGEQAG